MATGATGGVPTTTMHTQTFTGGLTANLYTCPANTICYLQMIDYVITSGSANVSFSFFLGTEASGATVYTRAVAAGSYFFDSESALALQNVYTRLDNPVSNLAGTQLGGAVKLYPGEVFHCSFDAGNGRLAFATLEVTSGS